MHVCAPAKSLSESGTFHSLITNNELKLPENGYEDNSLYNVRQRATMCAPRHKFKHISNIQKYTYNKNIKNTHTQELMSLCVCRQGSPEREPTEITRGRREEETASQKNPLNKYCRKRCYISALPRFKSHCHLLASTSFY